MDSPRTGDRPAPDTPRVHFVKWDDFDAMIKSLVGHVRRLGFAADCVVGIARGGCVPAVALSHALSVPDFSVISASVHKTDAVRAPRKTVAVRALASPPDYHARNVLLVDDVIHTGTTAFACQEFILGFAPSNLVCVALMRDTVESTSPSPSPPREVITANSVAAWVAFPWEPLAD